MSSSTRLLSVGGAAAVLALASSAWMTNAANPLDGPQADIRKIADALQKDDAKSAKDMAKALAEKAELEDVMHMFQLRTSKGEGVGPKPGAIKPDGIEAKLMNITKRVSPTELKNDGEALQRMAYIAAAIGEVAVHKVPQDTKGGKDPAKWKQWCEEMSTAGVELAKEVKGGDSKKVTTAATKLDNCCKNCHGVFRE